MRLIFFSKMFVNRNYLLCRDEDKDTTHQIVLESDDPDVCGENADNEDDTGMDDEIVVPPPRSHSTAFVTTQAFLDDNETATGPDGSGKSIVGMYWTLM